MSERIGQTIMKMVMATILEGKIEDTFWPEVILAIIHVKNLQPILVLEDSISLIKKQHDILPKLHHLRVLGLTVYVFLYEEERILKLAKWDVRALRKKLIEFDSHTIYRVYIKK